MKALIIAEKPSVAADIAKALGGFDKHDDYFENDDYVISSAVGHLLEIMVPEEYDVKRGKWSFNHLPMIPPRFDLRPLPKTESRLKVLARLIKRKDIDRIINACDAGREGELIFRYIAQYTNAKQPLQRLWLQSMTQQSIRDNFAKLRSDAEMLPLADAARCRSEADWLVGINGTRAMTAFNSKEGGFFLTPVGRVQTPTLSIVVEREEKIRRFKARDYVEIHATFTCQAGRYAAKWIDTAFKKDELDPEQKADRVWDPAVADAIAKACRQQPATVNDESKPTTQIAPALFDLTSLQREANARFGFSAKNTLGLAQALYEKHKVLTYPRTDSRHLPEDYIGEVQQTLRSVQSQSAYASFAMTIAEKGWVRPNKRIFDNSKISDHFAIIPTQQAPKNLSEPEQKLYDLVMRRFLAVFYPAAEFLVTTRLSVITVPKGHHGSADAPDYYTFKTEGKILVQAGWQAVYGKAIQDEDASLVAVQPQERPIADPIKPVALQTRPPARYSEATLLSAMESAGKLIDDESLRDAMSGKGLGTPATRAATIEGLLTEKYLVREGKELIPTAKSFQLLNLLRGLSVEELTSPELTGEWEHQLALMESGKLSRSQFMQDIARITTQMVDRAKNFNNDTIPGDYATLETPCPKCSGTVKENYRRFACQACDFSISKIPGGRNFEIPEVETLLRDKQLGPLNGFRSKQGWPFSALLKITPEFKMEFDFGQTDADALNEEIDFSQETPVGECPKCQSHVFEQPMNYLCEQSVGADRSCDFRASKVILQQEIGREQMTKLLNEGKTDLLTKFISKKGRPFKAFLVRGAAGKIEFEFEVKAGGRAPRAKPNRDAAMTDGVAGADEATSVATKAKATKNTTAKTTTAKTATKKVAATKAATTKVASKAGTKATAISASSTATQSPKSAKRLAAEAQAAQLAAEAQAREAFMANTPPDEVPTTPKRRVVRKSSAE